MLDYQVEKIAENSNELTEREKVIFFTFQLLSEDEQKTVLDYISSLLRK